MLDIEQRSGVVVLTLHHGKVNALAIGLIDELAAPDALLEAAIGDAAISDFMASLATKAQR